MPIEDPLVNSDGGRRDPLIDRVIDAATEVKRNLGSGFLEAVYQRAMEIELGIRGVPFSSHTRLEVFYKGQFAAYCVVDLLVEDKLIVELKAVASLADPHAWQVLNYVRAAGHTRGLLLNFGATRLAWRVLKYDHPTEGGGKSSGYGKSGT
jgi:GxxExxY protein